MTNMENPACLLGTDNPDPDATHLLAIEAAVNGRLEQAVRLLRQLTDDQPSRFGWRRDLATTLAAAGNWTEAVRECETALALAPAPDASLHALHGRVLYQSRFFDRAAAALERSLALQPDQTGRHALAASAYSAMARNWPERRHREALGSLQPGNPDATAALALAAWNTGDLAGCQTSLKALIDGGQISPYHHSFYLCGLLHEPGHSGMDIRREHEAWAARHCPGAATIRTYPNLFDPEKRLRIGYLTGEFIGGPSFHFLAPAIRCHNRDQFEVFLYHTCPRQDRRTAVFRDLADHWRNCGDLTDSALVGAILGDGIDLLVDYSGHFWHHKLTVFHQRPAPVQVSLPNYSATTGLAAIDYFVADPWVCPEGAESEYTETVVRLRDGCFVYAVPSDAPPLSPLPAEHHGYITFGVFQRSTKLHRGFWEVTAQVLNETPDSRLLVHYLDSDLDIPGSPGHLWLIAQMQSAGIDTTRVRCAGSRSPDEHMALMAEADIALDTFPYNGHTTACECLWMGVPFVSLTGESHVARVGTSILQRIGLGGLAARTPEAYIAKAVALAADRDRLIALRSGLREQMGRSSLTDAPAFTRNLEQAYRTLWRQRCQRTVLP